MNDKGLIKKFNMEKYLDLKLWFTISLMIDFIK
jgi:hypothetical protein